MKCRNCGKEVSDEDCRKVAEWTFCPDCFQGLLDQSAKKDSSSEMETPIVQPVKESSTKRCQLCGRSVEDGLFKQVGVWTFCPDCYDSMNYRPELEIKAPQEEAAKDFSPEATEDESVEERHNPIEPVNCEACGRKIPLRGAKELDGRLLCPDCHAALGKRVHVKLQMGPPGKTRPAVPDAMRKVVSGSEDLTPCDSCGRKVIADSLVETEGFFICEACRSTDVELALKLARRRHRQDMERLLSDSE